MKDFSIVIADDDEEDYFLLKDAFETKNYDHQLDYVTDGEDLIHLLSDRHNSNQKLPDLIILDINMPRMDGISTLKKIRESKHFDTISVFMYTTTSDPDQKQTCLSKGANWFQTKCIKFEKLLEFVDQIHVHLQKGRFVNKEI